MGATTGTYHVWLRGYAPNAAGDSLHLGLTPAVLPSTTQLIDGVTGFGPRQWYWRKQTMDGEVATFEVDNPGRYTLYLWAREDGLKLDRILLTMDDNYIPDNLGP